VRLLEPLLYIGTFAVIHDVLPDLMMVVLLTPLELEIKACPEVHVVPESDKFRPRSLPVAFTMPEEPPTQTVVVVLLPNSTGSSPAAPVCRAGKFGRWMQPKRTMSANASASIFFIITTSKLFL
jgi:hypothetical protein